MLFELRDFIQKQGLVSSTQLAREFQLDEEALKPMLNCWVKKGCIKSLNAPQACKSPCSRCRSSIEYYQFVGQ